MSQAANLSTLYPQAELRPASEVMNLERLGSFFPSRLSFMRSLIRRLSTEKAVVQRTVWEMDANGYGRAVYSVAVGSHTYSLIAFTNALDPDKRTDRVIAEAWDATFNLFDGIPTQADLDRLQANTSKQEAGRFSERELILSRANKSLRLFAHVVDCLAAGKQPDADTMNATGYLMRTTAVYGNGKFGIADRGAYAGRSGMSGPFQAEMLGVWLIRGFTHDLVEHIAHAKSPETFVSLSDTAKRSLGIGNSTGLGMAPFLVAHPCLLNNWIIAKETALARVRALTEIDEQKRRRALELAARVNKHLLQWNVADKRQQERILKLRNEFAEVANNIADTASWDAFIDAQSDTSFECQELCVSFVLELYPELVDGLEDCMLSLCEPKLEPAMKGSALKQIIEDRFAWALDIDFDDKSQTHQFWYVSEEKLEPRLGERYAEDGADLESPLDIARQVQALYADLQTAQDTTCAVFLMKHPQHRQVTKRVQVSVTHPYSEIHHNLIADTCLPIDMLRCKLSFFGASKFDPKSDRWTRITMFQGAPLFGDVCAAGDKNTDDWWLPVV